MIPVTQTKVHIKSSEGEVIANGNCWASAIASILEMPLSEVPNFEVWYQHKYKNRLIDGDQLWDELTQRFLIRHGYKIEFDYRFQCFHLTRKEWNVLVYEESSALPNNANYDACRDELKDEYYFISGPSPRGVSHVTIWQNDKMVHDPHPSGEGILEKRQYEVIRPLTAEEKEFSQDYYNGTKLWQPSITLTDPERKYINKS